MTVFYAREFSLEGACFIFRYFFSWNHISCKMKLLQSWFDENLCTTLNIWVIFSFCQFFVKTRAYFEIYFWNGQDSNPLSKCKKKKKKRIRIFGSQSWIHDFYMNWGKEDFPHFDIFFVKPKSMKSKHLSIDLTNFCRIGKREHFNLTNFFVETKSAK